jgi:hypothetical protein
MLYVMKRRSICRHYRRTLDSVTNGYLVGQEEERKEYSLGTRYLGDASRKNEVRKMPETVLLNFYEAQESILTLIKMALLAPRCRMA